MSTQDDRTGPPTEAEIRQALEERLADLFGGDPFSIDDSAAWDVLDPVVDSDMARVRTGWSSDFSPGDDHRGTLWADLRPSEIDELKEPIDEIIHSAEQAFITSIIDQVVAHAARFAAAHPDAPRGHWRPADKA